VLCLSLANHTEFNCHLPFRKTDTEGLTICHISFVSYCEFLDTDYKPGRQRPHILAFGMMKLDIRRSDGQ